MRRLPLIVISGALGTIAESVVQVCDFADMRGYSLPKIPNVDSQLAGACGRWESLAVVEIVGLGLQRVVSGCRAQYLLVPGKPSVQVNNPLSKPLFELL